MTFKLKVISENNWIVSNNDKKVGLLSEIENKYIFISEGRKIYFESKDSVLDYFSRDIFDNLTVPVVETIKTCYINGYPVDFDNPVEIKLENTDLPLYSKKIGSDIYYSAGHYCLHFPKNIMLAFCPKLSTLQNYKYSGPFKTEIEARSELIKLKKDNNYGK